MTSMLTYSAGARLHTLVEARLLAPRPSRGGPVVEMEAALTGCELPPQRERERERERKRERESERYIERDASPMCVCVCVYV